MDITGGRGRSAESLAQALREAGIGSDIACWPDFARALQAARASASDDDLILVFGSFRVVGEALHYLEIG
jgi:dihydrofolate synthase/folylpolyglutamate synthase